MDDIHYMNLALEQAQKAADIDEVPVGAVVVAPEGQVIGSGFNCPISTSDPTSHAEIVAMRNAAKHIGNYRLAGTTLYTTIEPCIMCMGTIIHARIKKVIYGACDPKWGAAESLYTLPEDNRLNHRPEIVSGVCREQASKLMKDFFINKRSTKWETQLLSEPSGVMKAKGK